MADTYTPLRTVSVGSRPPLNAVAVFADLAAANAHSYASTDIHKYVAVASPVSLYWVKAVSLGVATLVPAVIEEVAGDLDGDVAEPSVVAIHSGATRLPVGAIADCLILKRVGSDIVGVDSGGVTGVYFPDLPPSSPHGSDEEFASSHGLSLWDPGSYSSLAIVSGRLVATQTGSGSFRQAGAIKAIPDSEFAVATKCSMFGREGSIGLVVGGDLVGAPTTAPFYLVKFDNSSVAGTASSLVRGAFANYTTNSSFDVKANGMSSGYLRARVNGTTIHVDYSPDGCGWHNFINGATLAFTPVYFGLAFATTLAATTKSVFPFMRCASGAGSSNYDNLILGRVA